MARFYKEYQADTILQPLVGEISWSKHIVIMTRCKNTQERQFYILATQKYGWTNPSIGIIICKSKSRMIVEYALKNSNLPIGVATYALSSKLPEAYREYLPDTETIAKKLETLMNM